jgi:hypothetical protein
MREQRLNLVAQVVIAAAGLFEEGGSFPGAQVHRGIVETFNLLPAHKNVSRFSFLVSRSMFVFGVHVSR